MFLLHLLLLCMAFLLPIIFFLRKRYACKKAPTVVALMFGIFNWFIIFFSFLARNVVDYASLEKGGMIDVLLDYLHQIYLYELFTSGYFIFFVGIPFFMLLYLFLCYFRGKVKSKGSKESKGK